MKRALGAALLALALIGAACGGGDNGGSAGGSGSGELPTKIGSGGGPLNLIAWIGSVEDGSNDKNFDWITPFEDATGCQVKSKIADSSDEMVTLMRQGGGTVYDGVSASGDASNRLIAAGDVAEINTDLIP